MSSHLTPLEVCERLIAPLKDLGQIAGLGAKAAYAWRNPSQYRDAGDMSPRANRKLLKWAARRGIPLTADHLINGAKRAEIDDLLDEMRQQRRAHDRVAAE